LAWEATLRSASGGEPIIAQRFVVVVEIVGAIG